MQELWGFNDNNLESSRLGKLTEKQNAFLAHEHKTQSEVFLGVGSLFAVIFCCLQILLFGVRGFLPLLLSGDLSSLMDTLQSFTAGGLPWA